MIWMGLSQGKASESNCRDSKWRGSREKALLSEVEGLLEAIDFVEVGKANDEAMSFTEKASMEAKTD